jgi:hypothetical protein
MRFQVQITVDEHRMLGDREDFISAMAKIREEVERDPAAYMRRRAELNDRMDVRVRVP